MPAVRYITKNKNYRGYPYDRGTAVLMGFQFWGDVAHERAGAVKNPKIMDVSAKTSEKSNFPFI